MAGGPATVAGAVGGQQLLAEEVAGSANNAQKTTVEMQRVYYERKE